MCSIIAARALGALGISVGTSVGTGRLRESITTVLRGAISAGIGNPRGRAGGIAGGKKDIPN